MDRRLLSALHYSREGAERYVLSQRYPEVYVIEEWVVQSPL